MPHLQSLSIIRAGSSGGSGQADGSGSQAGAAAGMGPISEMGMLALVSGLGRGSLTSLNLSHCPGTGDALLACVAARLRALTSLSLAQVGGGVAKGREGMVWRWQCWGQSCGAGAGRLGPLKRVAEWCTDGSGMRACALVGVVA